ncbi:hypothetical protein [Pseudodesulfovibrio senegalensis]|uniref:Uncharacterized protein n=1 Tax=Pseudodesulfovibrio senegalensis TaxID=1721087 RepID=A0A6N6MXI6_9BACT|nr:hypothetical protein [Pseudodesulfovibrio senegalensis]KAB1437305.1 hypothetical protein F8A88_15375 [Pseudodesulfovibrio senegalensis]
MFKKFTIPLLISLLLVLPAIADDFEKEQQQIEVEITKPFEAGKDKDTAARFVDLKNQAVEFGLDTMELYGSVSMNPEELADGTHEVSVRWTHVKDMSGTNVRKALSTPLRTKIYTDEPINVGEKYTAVGNLDQLAKNLSKLKQAVEEKEEEISETTRESTTAVTGLTPSTGSYGNNSTGSTTEIPTYSTDVQITSYEDCDPFINEGAMQVEKQRKTIVTGETSGTIYSQSQCETFGVLAPIKIKQGDCGYQWLYDENATIEMVQWYYVDPSSGDEINVGECREGENKYPIEKFCDDCEDYYDEPNAVVFPQCRQGAYIGGTKIYATDCQPQSNVSYPVLTEYARGDEDQILREDDYTNNISYPLLDKYYEHPTKGKTYVARSVKSTTESWPHKHDTSECGWVMDDDKLQAQQMSNTYIDTPEGMVELQECAARTAPVPYAYIGLEERKTIFNAVYDDDDKPVMDDDGTPVDQTYTVPDGVTQLYVDVVAGGHIGDVTYIPRTSEDKWPKIIADTGGFAGQIIKDYPVITAGGTIIPLQVGLGTTTKNRTVSMMLGSAVIHVLDRRADSSWFNSSENKILATPIYDGQYKGGSPQGVGQNGFEFENDPGKPRIEAESNKHLASGCGYGAGGGGGPQATNGLDGIIVVKYKVMDYMRPDGTHYFVPYGGN